MFKLFAFVICFFAGIVFAQDNSGWYAPGEGRERCRNTSDGFLICRENFVNNFCYGKERMWINNIRNTEQQDRGSKKNWNDKKIVSVRKLNAACQYHGWSKFRLADDSWAWRCYINNREMQDSNCKGFYKR